MNGVYQPFPLLAGLAVDRPPKHPLQPAFQEARGWLDQQERLLTEAQRRVYDATIKRHAKERSHEAQKLSAMKDQLRQLAKDQKLEAELVLKPPVRIRPPFVRTLAHKIIKAEKSISELERTHHNERMTLLKDFEQQRLKDNKKGSLASSWGQAVLKAAKQEAQRSKDRDIDLSDSFDKSR